MDAGLDRFVLLDNNNNKENSTLSLEVSDLKKKIRLKPSTCLSPLFSSLLRAHPPVIFVSLYFLSLSSSI